MIIYNVHPVNPQRRFIEATARICINEGGIAVYPTDTVYGMGAALSNSKGIERIGRLLQKDSRRLFSFICSDFSHLSLYTKPISNSLFKLIRKNLPGPFTFILDANNNVPKYFKGKKKTVGIRIPDNNIIREIVSELGNPILSSSVHDDDEVLEYTADPELIHEKYQDFADVVIAGGYGELIPSTIVDCSGDQITVVREGKGILVY